MDVQETSKTYVLIKEKEMVEALREVGFERKEYPSADEMVFSRFVVGLDDLEVLIFSTISKYKHVSRSCGSDSIKIIIFSKELNRPVGSQTRVFRTAGWDKRLKERALQALTDAMTLKKCPEGHWLVVRTAKRGRRKGSKFLGCSHFPDCRYTEAYNGTISEGEIVEALLDEL